MCLLLAIYRQKRQHPHTLNTLSVRGLRVVDDEPRRDKAIIANLDKSRATLMKESDPLCFFTVSTKPLLDLLRGIVVMLERKRREMALFDPLPGPLLARWSPRDIHPLLLPKQMGLPTVACVCCISRSFDYSMRGGLKSFGSHSRNRWGSLKLSASFQCSGVSARSRS